MAGEVYLLWRKKISSLRDEVYLPFLIRFQSSSESTAVFFVKYWSTFREGLESFPQGTGEVSVCLSRYFPRNGPGRAETSPKKVHALSR